MKLKFYIDEKQKEKLLKKALNIACNQLVAGISYDNYSTAYNNVMREAKKKYK